MRGDRCPRKLSYKLQCNERLQSRVVDGVTVPHCPRCVCKDTGVCIDCRQAPVVGRPGVALRCAACRKLADHANTRRWYQDNQQTVRAKWLRLKERLKGDPAAYAAFLAKKKLRMLARTPAQQKRRKSSAGSVRQQRANARYRRAQRERLLAYQRAIREKRRAGVPITHPCVSCPAPLTGRQRKCRDCDARDRRMARAILIPDTRRAA